MNGTIWNGTLRFREVTIPVGLAPTVSKGDVGFRTLHRACGQAVGRAAICPEHGQVPVEELVKGYEVAKGQYVLLEDAELAQIAPEDSHTIEIVACVSPRDLDPIGIQSRYFLAPADSPLGCKPYLLLRDALLESDTVALARFVAFGSEWIATISPLIGSSLLLLERRVPQEDLLAARGVELALAGADPPTKAEAALAAQVVEQLRPFRMRKALLTSEHRRRVQQLIEAKLAGQPLVVPAARKQPQAQTRLTVDLTDALKRSLTKRPKRTDGRPPRALTNR